MNLFELFAKVSLNTDEYDRGVSKVAKSGESLSGKLKSGLATAGKAAAHGIGMIAGAAGTAGGALLALEGSTEEYRVAQGKLNTAFDAAGMSADVAQQAYRGFYEILGDTDTATEASQLLSNLVKSEEDVAKWTDIAAGVYGTFGDALPIEGLIESANETAKVGQVTGSLADALNWGALATETFGVALKANTKENEEWNKAVTEAKSAEDFFNLALQDCSTEAERNELIMQALSKGYMDATYSFYDMNSAVIMSRRNQALLDETLAKLGETVSNVKNRLLSDFLPGISKVVDAFADMINGVSGADQAFVDAISSLVSKLTEKLPEFIDFGVKIIKAIVSGVSQSLPVLVETLLPALIDMAVTLLEEFVAVLPDILSAIAKALPQVVTVIFEAIPSILPALIEAVGVLITSLMAAVPQMITAAFQASPIAATIASLIGGLKLAGSFSGLIKSVTGVVSSLSGLSGAFSTVLGVVKGAAGAFSGLFSILAANPIALVIAAVAALVAGIIHLWNTNEGFRDAVGAIWEAIKGFFVSAKDAIVSAWNTVADFFKGVWEGIKEAFSDVAEFFGGVFSAAWEAIKNAWGAAVDFFRGIWEGIKEAFSTVAEVLGGFFSAAWDAIKSVWSTVTGFFTQIAEGVKAIFSAVAEALIGFFSAAWEGIKTAWSAAVDFFKGVWEGIKAVFSVVAEVLGGFFKKAWEAIKSVWSTVVGFFKEVWEGIKTTFSAVVDTLSGFFKKAWEKIKSVWSTVVGFFKGVWDGIKNVFASVAGFFKEKFQAAVNSIKDAWTGITDFFKGIWEKIKGVFADVWSHFKEIGGNIVRGLWEGIQGLAGWLWDKVSGWASSIWDGVKSVFHINSPSKKFYWIGEMLVKGMTSAIDEKGEQAVKAASAWSDDILSASSLSTPTYDLGVAQYDAGPQGQAAGPGKRGGDTYVTINSPVAVDPVQAAREWRKTTQRLAMSL